MENMADRCAVRCLLDDDELLNQLAEELIELSLAAGEISSPAFKEMRKTNLQTGESVSLVDEFMEEVADVELVMEILLDDDDRKILHSKMKCMDDSIDAANWFYFVNGICWRCMRTAKAALKMRRVITQINPTPTTWPKAHDDLMSGLADLLHRINVAKGALVLGAKKVDAIKEQKAARWAHRLDEHWSNASDELRDRLLREASVYLKKATGGMEDGNVQQDPEELLGNG